MVLTVKTLVLIGEVATKVPVHDRFMHTYNLLDEMSNTRKYTMKGYINILWIYIVIVIMGRISLIH